MIKPEDVIPADTLVLITQGEYSDYGIVGLFKADSDTVVPKDDKSGSRFSRADITKLSLLLREVDFIEVHSR